MYKKVTSMKDKVEVRRQSIYELLEDIEKGKPTRINQFWRCVFKDSTVNQYPILKQLRNEMDKGLLKDVQKSEERPGPSDRDNQQGHSSNQPIPTKKKKKLRKPTNASPLPKMMHVTCGDQKGILSHEKIAKGEPCIKNGQNWYTPLDFLVQSGKARSSHWKSAIRYKDVPIEKLFTEHRLTCPGFHKKKARKSQLLSSSEAGPAVSGCEDEEGKEEDEEEDNEEEEMQEEEMQTSLDGEEVSQDDEEEEPALTLCTKSSDAGSDLEGVTDERPSVNQNKFPVKCGELAGSLHSSRFASGKCGKSIRTSNHWLSPEEFVKAGSAVGSDTLWERDIQCIGEPLSVLIQRNVLRLHPEQCPCLLCNADSRSLENQKNDDECCVCRGESESNLVLCDHCPLSFHPECHLPRVQPSALTDDERWMCTFCIWGLYEPCLPQVTPERMPMCPVSNNMLQCHFLLLSLYDADQDHIFAKDPSTQVRRYSAHIAKPMWLDKIRQQLLDDKYNTVGQLLTDIRLIFSNCDQFNRKNKKFRVIGDDLKELHERVVKKVFRIQQQNDVLSGP